MDDNYNPDDDLDRVHKYTRPVFNPYQQKVFYEVYEDSSEVEEDSPISPDDDDRCAEEQPYLTPAHIRYKKDVDQMHIPDFAKRSDIVITSTLSLNLIPRDARIISEIHQADMKEEDIIEFIDEKNAF